MNGSTGELAFIDWLREQIGAHPAVRLGPGDDAAILKATGTSDLIVTTDMLLDGSCFILAEAGPRRVGRKAIAVNLSDIAAMAARPLAAVVSVGLPRSGGQQLAQELFAGMQSIANEFDVPIVGGDTNSWDGPLVISVTMLGTATAKGAVTRGGARIGDWLFVTGPLGGSIGGHHLDFTPRVREALLLHQLVDLHAMIDISDGLALDLHRLCKESQCGAVLDAEKIPITPSVQLQNALADGEDFELLFAVSAAEGQRLVGQTQIPCFPIGTITERDILLLQHGQLTPLPAKGYEHRLE